MKHRINVRANQKLYYSYFLDNLKYVTILILSAMKGSYANPWKQKTNIKSMTMKRNKRKHLRLIS